MHLHKALSFKQNAFRQLISVGGPTRFVAIVLAKQCLEQVVQINGYPIARVFVCLLVGFFLLFRLNV